MCFPGQLARFEDSFIDLKGTRIYIRYNTFDQGNEPNIKRGVATIDRDRPLSSYEHVIHDNVFNMDDTTTPLVEANSGTRNVYAFRNARNPAGARYNSRVTEGCPPWYPLCDTGDNILPTAVITAPGDATFIDEGTLTAGRPKCAVHGS